MSKLVCLIVIAIASGLGLAACQNIDEHPNDCVHRTFGCDMNGRPI